MVTPGASVVIHADEELGEVAYTGIAAALSYAETDVKLFGKPGAYKGRRMGLVSATAESAEEARDRAALAAHKIEVTSTPGLLAQGGARGIEPEADNVPDIEVVEYEGGVELFVAGDDVYFSSVSPRPSDTAMLTCYTQRFSAFDLHARAILGYPIDATLVTPGASVVIHADEELNEVAYTGVAAALNYAETDVKLFGKPGAVSYTHLRAHET